MNVPVEMDSVPKCVQTLKGLSYATATLVIGLMEMEEHAQVSNLHHGCTHLELSPLLLTRYR